MQDIPLPTDRKMIILAVFVFTERIHHWKAFKHAYISEFLCYIQWLQIPVDISHMECTGVSYIAVVNKQWGAADSFSIIKFVVWHCIQPGIASWGVADGTLELWQSWLEVCESHHCLHVNSRELETKSRKHFLNLRKWLKEKFNMFKGESLTMWNAGVYQAFLLHSCFSRPYMW